MLRQIAWVAASGAVMLAATPSLAFSLSGAPINPNTGAHIADPDAAMPHLASDSGVGGHRDLTPEAHGPMVRYDLGAAKGVRPRQEALDSKVSDLADARNNPFMSGN